jgi:hypothetical protein
VRLAVIACVLAILLAGGGQSSAVLASPSPRATANVATLLARPVKLPAVRSGSACPVTPVSKRSVSVTDPRGHGPFYLGGPMPHGQFAWNKTLWILADGARGPLLFRGGRVDGTGSLKFSGNPADHADPGVTLSSGGGVSATFYERVIGGGTEDALYFYPSSAGCYALQVDGTSFEDVIVISAV